MKSRSYLPGSTGVTPVWNSLRQRHGWCNRRKVVLIASSDRIGLTGERGVTSPAGMAGVTGEER